MKIKEITRQCYDKDDKIVTIHDEMKRLHDAFGIDWTKPYTEIEHHGKFTVNSLLKEMESYCYLPKDCLILALVQGQEHWDADEWRVVRITNGDFEINMPYCVDDFYRKGDFNEARKKTDCEAIFFAQSNEYLTATQFRRNSWGGGYWHETKQRDTYGRFKTADGLPWYNATLDKSGYCLNQYQSDLNDRLKIYKTEKAKAEYLKTDNTEKIATLERLVTSYKEKLSSAILSVSTPEGVQELDNLLGWGGLYSIINKLDTFKEKTQNKSYESIEQSNNDYDYVAKKCYAYLG